MSKATKVWLIIAASLLVVGMAMFIIPIAASNFNLSGFGTAGLETKTSEVTEAFNSISINGTYSDITVRPSTDGKCTVTTRLGRNSDLSVKVSDGTLAVDAKAQGKKWYEHIGFNIGSSYITVYLPSGTYGALNISSVVGDIDVSRSLMFDSIDIKSESGDIRNYASATNAVKFKSSAGEIYVEHISAGSLELSLSMGSIDVSDITCGGDIKADVSAGKIELSNVRCLNFVSDSNNCKLELEDVLVTEKINIEIDVGYVEFEDCDGGEIYVKTDTGKISGSLLSDKVFVTKTSTGRINVPGTVTGGKCELITGTGNIDIKIKQK